MVYPLAKYMLRLEMELLTAQLNVISIKER